MFLNDIPSSFHYVCEVSDNYIVFCNVSKMYNNNTYEVYYQYIHPSTYVLHVTDYKIKFSQADTIDLDYNYTNNGYFNYLDNSNFSFSVDTLEVDSSNFTDSIYERSDFTNILICSVIIVWFVFKCIFCVTALADKEVF